MINGTAFSNCAPEPEKKKTTMAANSTQQSVQQSFRAFFEEWLLRKQNLLDQLLKVSIMPDSENKIDHQKMLIQQVLYHYQQHYEEKFKVANVDVFLLFSPIWLSAYERALLWIGDHKPSFILRLVDGAVEGLTAEQKQRLQQVRDDAKRAEREVSGAMASVQESVASPHMVGPARKAGRLLNGETSELDSAIEALKKALMEVSERADELRVSTVRKVVEILTPPQRV